MKNANWIEIKKNVTGKYFGVTPVLTIPSNKSSLLRLNLAATTLLGCNRIKVYVDAKAKKIALQPTLDDGSFIINATAKTFSSRGLIDAVDLKNLPKKMKGEWDANLKAIVFDYSRCAVVKSNIFDY